MAPSIGIVAGVVEVGILIATFLYGICTVQAYIYFRSGMKDPRWFKIMVIFVWLMETWITILNSIYLYSTTITDFGDIDALGDLPWSLDFSFSMSGFISAAVQSFFAWRIYVLSGHLAISVIAWFFCVARIGIPLAICVLNMQAKTITNFERLYPWTVTFHFSVAMFVDVYNTCMLCFWLCYRRSDHQRSRAIVDKILTWTIETGLTTSICGIVILVTYLIIPDEGFWISFVLFYPKLYSNSLLLSLNGRSALRENRRGPEVTVLSEMRVAPRRPMPEMNIIVTQSTDVTSVREDSLAKSEALGSE